MKIFVIQLVQRKLRISNLEKKVLTFQFRWLEKYRPTKKVVCFRSKIWSGLQIYPTLDGCFRVCKTEYLRVVTKCMITEIRIAYKNICLIRRNFRADQISHIKDKFFSRSDLFSRTFQSRANRWLKNLVVLLNQKFSRG